MGWLSRRRHRLGFGVHSPFAYYVVKDIIAPGHRYGYYAEKTIAALVSPSRRFTRLALMVHRLAGRLNYKVMVQGLPATVEQLMVQAAQAACPCPLPDAMPLLITSSPMEKDTLLLSCKEEMALLTLAPYANVVPPPYGVVFHDTCASLYLPYLKTAFVDYDIRF